MFSIIGLGNPGKEYIKNRHNAGFLIIEEIASFFNAPNWKKKHKSLISKGIIKNQPVVLVKPKTFMNLSGDSILEINKFYKIPTENIIIIHDDLELSPGKIKAKFAGGNAGHKGLINISKLIGNNYYRIRIGIGHPGKDNVSRYVLEDFEDHELILLEKNMTYIKNNIHLILDNQIDTFNKDSNKI